MLCSAPRHEPRSTTPRCDHFNCSLPAPVGLFVFPVAVRTIYTCTARPTERFGGKCTRCARQAMTFYVDVAHTRLSPGTANFQDENRLPENFSQRNSRIRNGRNCCPSLSFGFSFPRKPLYCNENKSFSLFRKSVRSNLLLIKLAFQSNSSIPARVRRNVGLGRVGVSV